jgi:hypothetical protein
MTVQRALSPEATELSLVENRLNVAALALAALMFSGSFTLSLFESLHLKQRTDFRLEFLHILAPLAIGVITSIASIACFLQSQQSKQQVVSEEDGSTVAIPRPNYWYRGREWWFSLGQIFLYMALAQALSASLTEIVYGVSLSSNLLGILLGVLALPVWWVLLFFAPITFLRRMRRFEVRGERWALNVIYGTLVAGSIALTGLAYSVRGGGSFIRNVADQFYQPLTWHQGWAE